MARNRRNGKRLRQDGKRTHRRDCCCDGCIATTPQAIAQYLLDNAVPLTLEIEAADFSDLCGAGNCDPVVGTYTVPIWRINPTGSGNYLVEWRDSFTFKLCGVTRTTFIDGKLDIATTGTALMRAFAQTAPTTPLICEWRKGIPWSGCSDILTFDEQLPAVDTSHVGGVPAPCRTFVTDGAVWCKLEP
jgi:hypothetical protein